VHVELAPGVASKDATADYSDEAMHAALDINIPNYASAVVSTEEIVASISVLADSHASASTSLGVQKGIER
jgi:hypothetical protein